MSDEEIKSKVHDAVVEETITRKNARVRVRIAIKNLGEVFITKKALPKGIELPDGTSICVEIYKHNDGRLLVSKIISINGENYTPDDTGKVSSIGLQEDFPDLDQRYVLNQLRPRINKKGKKFSVAKQKTRLTQFYGLRLFDSEFLRNWQENSYIKLSEYSEVHDIIPDHPELKFVGEIVRFNFFKGWQGFIYCKSINSLIYVQHSISRSFGSLKVGAKIKFFIGTKLDTRGELQFVARDWESNVNRGNTPEPALSLEFEEFKESVSYVESLLSESDQFLLITSYKNGKQVFKSNEIVEYVSKKYPKYPYQVLEWPKFKLDKQNSKATSGAGRFSHPLIANYVSAAVVLFPRDEGGEEE